MRRHKPDFDDGEELPEPGDKNNQNALLDEWKTRQKNKNHIFLI